MQVSLGERSVGLQRQEGSSDGISSDRTLLAHLFQGIKKKKEKEKKKKTPGSDSAVRISLHSFSVVSFRFMSLFL